MRKQLGMLASFLVLSAMTFTGCSDNKANNCCAPVCSQPCPTVCPAPCRPVCEPVCRPVCEPVCQPVCPPVCEPVCEPVCCKPVEPPCACEPMCKILTPCKHPPSNELKCFDFITVTARNPNMCLLGEQYPLDFDVRACDDVCDVVVTTHLPEGVSFIRSEPPAQVDGKKLTWYFGSMSKCECRPARVWVKCECEGEQCACFCATATPVRFCALLCAKPILTCEKCGPEEVCPGDPVHYRITVSNRGSCVAEDVVVTDNIPPEMEHSSCSRTLTFKLGSLAPCETKTVNLCLTAVKRGRACNTIVVSACNADTVSCQWCTNVACCASEIDKVGPKEVAIGKNADYQITASNTGDIVLTDVVVTDYAPSSTSIVSANGAKISGNQAVWRLRELQPGEKVSFGITLTTCTPGCFTNRVTLTNCQQCNACDEFTTRWKGRPALNVCIVDSDNPICVGENTRYTIKVVNQGSESDNNVRVVARFPRELTPIKICGESRGTINGQVVTFEPIEDARPRQTMTFCIDAKGRESGDARVVVEVSSDSIRTPIVQQESTIVN